jgi:flagellar protein FliO/FliZ
MRYLLFVLLNAMTQLVHAEALPTAGISHTEMVKVIFGLLLVLVIILLLSWGIKKINTTQFASQSGFKSIAGMMIGPREKIQLIQVGTRYLLIGVTGSSITLLCDFEDKLPEGFAPNASPAFGDFLKSALRKS